jgi:hypothetical protein
MKPELERKLINDFPELYIEKDRPPTESLMCFGFACDDGWYPIVYSFSKCIKHHVDSKIEHEIIMREILSFKKIFVGWKRGWKTRYWYERLWQNIKEYWRLRNNPLDVDTMQVRAVQVKEKFGGLRFYIHAGNDQVYGMIEMAEMMSYVTCEVCGSHGTMHTRGSWLKTLCPKCAKPTEYKQLAIRDEEDS